MMESSQDNCTISSVVGGQLNIDHYNSVMLPSNSALSLQNSNSAGSSSVVIMSGHLTVQSPKISHAIEHESNKCKQEDNQDMVDDDDMRGISPEKRAPIESLDCRTGALQSRLSDSLSSFQRRDSGTNS